MISWRDTDLNTACQGKTTAATTAGIPWQRGAQCFTKTFTAHKVSMSFSGQDFYSSVVSLYAQSCATLRNIERDGSWMRLGKSVSNHFWLGFLDGVHTGTIIYLLEWNWHFTGIMLTYEPTSNLSRKRHFYRPHQYNIVLNIQCIHKWVDLWPIYTKPMKVLWYGTHSLINIILPVMFLWSVIISFCIYISATRCHNQLL